MGPLSELTKLTRHSNAVSAGTSIITPASGIDMTGFEGVIFAVLWGSITAAGVQSVEVHTSNDDGSADAYTAISGSSVAVADSDDNKMTWVCVHRPRERYLKCIVNRATQNSAIDGIIAQQYGPALIPTTHDSTTVSGGETHIAAAEGTA